MNLGVFRSASEPCPASYAQPCLHRAILFSVLASSPDEGHHDENEEKKHEQADDGEDRDLSARHSTEGIPTSRESELNDGLSNPM